MKYFLQNTKDAELTEGELHYRITPRYVELTQRKGDLCLVWYLIFRDAYSLIVATCWENMFDSMVIEDDDDISNIRDTYPTQAQVIRNSVGGRFSQGALVQMEDFDDGELKWFVISIAGNINISSADDLFEGRTADASKTVLDKSVTMLLEIQNNKPSYLKTILRGLKKGFISGAKYSIKAHLRHGFADFFDSSSVGDQPVSPDSVIQKRSFEEYMQRIAEERLRRGSG